MQLHLKVVIDSKRFYFPDINLKKRKKSTRKKWKANIIIIVE